MQATGREAPAGRQPWRPLAQDAMTQLTLQVAGLGQQLAMQSSALFRLSATGPAATLDRLSAHAALRAAAHARRRVPAYRAHLQRAGWCDDPTLPAAQRVQRLPETDKISYINAYSTEGRCLDGRLSGRGISIDESAGSTGTPYNWVRGAAETRELHRGISQFLRYLVGDDVFTINGFSMGAWATGVSVGEALRRNGIVKSTGPDVAKIVDTLRFFGPSYHYIITGYPPFLKHLIDASEKGGFDWSRYHAHAIVGGEGMSESLRAYLERRFQGVYSGYGASDLAPGMAIELPLSVWIRKRAAANPALHRALFGNDPRLPMLFQYNPLDYYIETNAAGELVVTINRLSILSPRIRYNVHDAGGVIPFDRMLGLLRECGLDPLAELPPSHRPFRLPFLYLFGRSDNTVAYMGANIYPEDVEQALYAAPEDAYRLGAFCLELVDIGDGEQRVCVHVEAADGASADADLAERLRRQVFARLMAVNRDFKTSVDEDPSAAELLVRLHEPGAGPFAANRTRIKRRYVVSTPRSGARGAP
jgi:phenylacetate-CoA ligase